MGLMGLLGLIRLWKHSGVLLGGSERFHQSRDPPVPTVALIAPSIFRVMAAQNVAVDQPFKYAKGSGAAHHSRVSIDVLGRECLLPCEVPL